MPNLLPLEHLFDAADLLTADEHEYIEIEPCVRLQTEWWLESGAFQPQPRFTTI